MLIYSFQKDQVNKAVKLLKELRALSESDMQIISKCNHLRIEYDEQGEIHLYADNLFIAFSWGAKAFAKFLAIIQPTQRISDIN